MRLRPATFADAQFLAEMMLNAGFRPGTAPPLTQALDLPHIAEWLEDWPRPDDFGVIAEEDDGTPLGACWCRHLQHGKASGFVAVGTPVLAIAVVDGQRGRGIGEQLIRGVIDEARRRDVHALSLSVGRSNPALKLYERMGFERLPVDETQPLRMVLRL